MHTKSVTVCFIATIASVLPFNVEWDSSERFWSVPIKPGQSAHLRCIGTDLDDQDEVTIEKMVTTNSDVVPVAIATNSEVHRPYSTLGRYTATHEVLLDESRHIMDLDITGADGNDGGKYRCTATSGQQVSQEMTLIIQVPLHEVYAIYQPESTGNEQKLTSPQPLTWRAHADDGTAGDIVGCAASIDGGVDEPNIQVLIGGNDVTNLFSASPWDTADVTDAGFYHFRSYKTVRSSVEPVMGYHGQSMVCQGYASGYEDDIMAVTMTLNVEAAPTVTCVTDDQSNIPLLDKAMTLRCVIVSNPAPSVDVRVSYSSDGVTSEESQPSISAASDAVIGNIVISRQDDGVTSSITFSVASVTEYNLHETYTLTASNKYGQGSASIEILGDGMPSSTTKPAMHLSFLMILYVFNTVLNVFLS